MNITRKPKHPKMISDGTIQFGNSSKMKKKKTKVAGQQLEFDCEEKGHERKNMREIFLFSRLLAEGDFRCVTVCSYTVYLPSKGIQKQRNSNGSCTL